MVHPVQVRPISNDEGMRLLRIVRRGSGWVVTWRRARMVLLSAQGMPVARIAEVTFTIAGGSGAERGGKSEDREPRARRRATCTCPHGVRHLFAAYDLRHQVIYRAALSRA